MSDQDPSGLDARSAELLARQVNTAFTMVSGYGTEHPMFHKACETLQESLTSALDSLASVSLLMDRGALFIDKFPVGQRFNPRRLMNLLSQLGIESISFSRGVSVDDLQHLMMMSADQSQYPDVESISAGLESLGVAAIRLNYITFRQVTADQKVVGEGEPDQLTSHSMPGIPDQHLANLARASDSFDPIASLLSLDELVKNPEHYASQLQEHSSDDGQRRQLVRQLRNLVAQVERGEIKADGALSSEAVLGAVNDLRSKVRRNLDTRRDVELILSEEDQVMGEIDQLTYSTLVSLVREEFRDGQFSASRMAQIINRMLPDARDLKRLLPQLKQGLLAEGMSMSEWGKLVHELSSELRGEHLVKALEQGADSVGLDVDEIVDQIREDPAEAARLIVMATELRRSGAGEEEQLSAAFTDYIERISDKLSLELGQEHPGEGVLDSQLIRVRQLLVDQLNRQGLPPELIESVRERLQAARSQPVRKSPEAPSSPAGESELPDGAAQLVESSPTEQTAVPADAGNADSIDAVDPASGTDAASPPKGAEPRPVLPARVLNPSNTAFFLNREIKSSERYKTPFSVIKVSVELVRDRPGKPRTPEAEDLVELMPQVYREIIAQLRDLDLVGSLDKAHQAVPLMILPMTAADGVEIVIDRLLKRLKRTPFRLAGMPTQVMCAVSSASFNVDDEESSQAFIERIDEEHEIVREMLHLDQETDDHQRQSLR